MGLMKSKQNQYLVPEKIVNGTCFDDLSNEIFYEIFDYLSYRDIVFAFGKLNERIQCLIDSYAHYVNLQQHISNDSLPLPQHIHSLKISANYQLQFIDLSSISSINSLLISNIRIHTLTTIFNILSLEELQYVYLGAGLEYYEQKQIAQIQEKILSLGELKLQKCVMRTKLCANLDLLPNNLPFIEYLRIDGCENISILHDLVVRMPNIKLLDISINTLTESNTISIRHAKQIYGSNSLVKLILRLHDINTMEQFIPLFVRHCSNLKKLIIYLSYVRISESTIVPVPDSRSIEIYKSTISIISELLPQITIFYLRQNVYSSDIHSFNQLRSFPCHTQEIPCSLKHKAYRVIVPVFFKTHCSNTD